MLCDSRRDKLITTAPFRGARVFYVRSRPLVKEVQQSTRTYIQCTRHFFLKNTSTLRFIRSFFCNYVLSYSLDQDFVELIYKVSRNSTVGYTYSERCVLCPPLASKFT